MRKSNQNNKNLIEGISNDTGFNTPLNYFDDLEDTIISKIREEHIPDEVSFLAPNDYFSTFDEELLSKIEFPQKDVKVISLKSRFLKIIPTAAAACMLLFIGLNYFSTNEKISFETISNEELELWFNESNLENDAINLLEFVDTDLNNNNTIEEDTSINDDDILEYLNTINNSTLLTEIES